MNNRFLGTLALVWMASLPLTAQETARQSNSVAIAQALAPSMVRVEHMLQFDRGEMPRGIAWMTRCPNCGEFHVNEIQSYVKEERPIEIPGFLLSPTLVLTEDLMTHPRFIKSTSVRFGDQVVAAKVSAYVKDHNAVLLELAEPLKATKPLAFDPSRKGPYVAVAYTPLNGDWKVNLQPVGGAVSFPEKFPPFLTVPSGCLIVDTNGVPVGASFKEELALGDAWKGSPDKWPALTAAEMAQELARLEKAAGQNLLRVVLNFRSPKVSPGERFRASDDKADNDTEKNVMGVLVEGGKVLILADLPPRVTARLQRIAVYTADGGVVSAKFLASLKDYGGFLATLEKPLPGTAKFSAADILQSRNQLLYSAEVSIQGEKRIAYYLNNRIASFRQGWRRQIHPQVPGAAESLFLFDGAGALLALPISRREKTSAIESSDHSKESAILTASTYLREAVANPDRHGDPANVPLSEGEENRLAWLGVEMQPLNRELARAHHISDQTQDGESGALITHVYAGSPAAQAGLEPGFILLRVHLPDEPSPVEVKLDENRMYQEAFPWDKLDQIQERFFDRIPTPWPPSENGFIRLLTDAGIGTSYQAEFFADGKVLKKEFTVTASPAHYEAAARHKADALGLTVRDLTYEVRRYLQRKEEDPGVVVSKVEAGSKAAVSGIKPYELITHINDQPVRNVKEFEKLTQAPGELSFSVKRMALGRQVKIKAATAIDKAEEK